MNSNAYVNTFDIFPSARVMSKRKNNLRARNMLKMVLQKSISEIDAVLTDHLAAFRKENRSFYKRKCTKELGKLKQIFKNIEVLPFIFSFYTHAYCRSISPFYIELDIYLIKNT